MTPHDLLAPLATHHVAGDRSAAGGGHATSSPADRAAHRAADRAPDRAAHCAAPQHDQLLAQAAAVLLSSLDHEETVGEVASLLVPAHACALVVDLVEGRNSKRIAAASIDPQATDRLRRSLPPPAAAAVAEALRTGESVSWSREPATPAPGSARGDAWPSWSGAFSWSLATGLAVPLRTEGRVLGVLVAGLGAAGVSAEQRSLFERLGGLVRGAVVNGRQHDEVRLSAAALRQQALTDPVTGLANRTLVIDHLRLALKRLSRSRGQVVVLFCDVDQFKTVNDSHGHDAGDQLLLALADRLRRVLRPEDTLGRFGGDEFVVVCEEPRDARGGAALAQRLLEAARVPLLLDSGELIRPSMSIGVAVVTGDASPEQVLGDADAALYAAKRQGRDRWASAQRAAGQRRAVPTLSGEQALAQALDRDELRLHYQPLVRLDSASGTEASGPRLPAGQDGEAFEVVGLEALLRWERPDRGLLSAPDFLDVAEQSGLVVSIGEWVLREATRWAAQLAHPLQVAVNISPYQLWQRGFVPQVASALADSGLPPSRLVLEVTESAAVLDVPAAAARLAEAKELGVRLAFDDFGTGYSSLTALQRLPWDVLKIDRSFVEPPWLTGKALRLLIGMIGLGRGLQLTVCAEGVQTRTQQRRLRALGCQLAQGYYFGRPRPAGELSALLGER